MSQESKVLSSEDLEFFDQNGYVIVPNAVPQENIEALVETIYAFLGISRERDDSWYRQPVNPGGNVEMYQNQALWNNRQHPRVHRAFSQLWGREDLLVSIDRAAFKPPPDDRFPEYQKTGFLHLDTTTDELPIPFRLQGVLYLTDTAADQGGFHCLPGWHKRTEEWIEVSKPAGSLRGEAMYELPVKPIPGKAGDLLIWHVALPHGNGWNTSTVPRLAQYITMGPADVRRKPLNLESRIKAWREHSGPLPELSPRPYAGDPRGWEKENCQTAELTSLGRKLLGLDPW